MKFWANDPLVKSLGDILERYAVTVDEERTGCRHDKHHEPYTAMQAKSDILDIIIDREKSAVDRVLDWLMKNGAGGGNWRRLLWLAKEASDKK